MLYQVFKQCVLILFAVLVLVSCDVHTLYDQQVALPENGWFKNEAVKFDLDISDTITPYHFELTLRHTTNYRYCNLYIFLTTRFPEGKMSRDTIELVLADPTGQWVGKGWGNLRDNEITLKSPLFFPQKGHYQFLVQQAMRTDTLNEITHLGLRLTTYGQ
ncbi:MAG: gliding motility lipoprotein GldH [Bacteroidetes bacterium]|nr:gliding motility lipoprotein GldH [Bacteroidota bacterium]